MIKPTLKPAVVSLILIAAWGCGGGSTSTATQVSNEASDYVAMLPDGSALQLSIDYPEKGQVHGSFFLSATGTTGVFGGAVSGKTLRIVCDDDNADGTFNLDGEILSNGHFSLTKSDLAGAKLDFSPYDVRRASGPFKTFTLKTGTSNAVQTFSIDQGTTRIVGTGDKQYQTNLATWGGYRAAVLSYTTIPRTYIYISINGLEHIGITLPLKAGDSVGASMDATDSRYDFYGDGKTSNVWVTLVPAHASQ